MSNINIGDMYRTLQYPERVQAKPEKVQARSEQLHKHSRHIVTRLPPCQIHQTGKVRQMSCQNLARLRLFQR